MRCIWAALFLAGTLAGQPGPRFDVVSIRPVPPNLPPVMREQNWTPVLPGGQYVNSRASLLWMIGFAYDVKQDLQLTGLPNWAKTQIYSVAAKPAPGFPLLPPDKNTEQVRLMMRAMLADRFHLTLHTETRQERVFHLEVANGGVKLKEVAPPVPPEKEGHVNAAVGNRYGRMIGKKSTMAGIASVLTLFLNQTVVDRTGLKAYYDFDVKWSALEPPDGPPSPGFGAEGTALLISALRDQFGLRLVKGTGPVEYWVVDHVEPPSEN